MAQPPQLKRSLCSSTQEKPHFESGLGQSNTHLPAEQNCAPGQTLPHLPQFAGSESGLVQALPQVTSGKMQLQWPPWHCSSPWQTVAQLPQWLLSKLVSTQEPLQL